MKKLLTLLLLGAYLSTWAGNDPNAYNIQRALEAFRNGDENTTFSFLSNELRSNPTNGYAHLYTAEVCEQLGYKSAVINYGAKAIQLLWKTEPQYVASTACSIADIYLEAGDTVTARNYLDKALKANKKHQYTLLSLAQLFEDTQDAGQLAKIGEQFQRFYPKDAWGYIILARAYNMQARYDDAITQADKALLLVQTDEKNLTELALRTRSKARIGLKRYPEALSDAVKAGQGSMTSGVLNLIAEIADSVPGSMVIDTLDSVATATPTESIWALVLADIYADRHDYVNAAYMDHKALLIEPDPSVFSHLGSLYTNYLNAPELAEQQFLQAIQRDSTNVDAYLKMANLYHDFQHYDDALQYADKALSLCASPAQRASVLYTRGHILKFMQRYNDALQDYYRALTAEPDNSNLWFNIGELHLLTADTLMADKAFQQGRLALGADSALTAEAWLAMGNIDKALEVADNMIKDPESPYQHYNAACVYAQAGKTDKALNELQQALQHGFRNFLHLNWDTDLDNIRELPRYNELLEQYKLLSQQDLDALNQRIQQL